ncbi:MAG: translation elongation factor Ts [Oscillospiraceae bacterium]|nr:translation elongation factor Ts [Oscillospiraceae bacterium]
MANITAKDVAALRERTGVGMMDCKKALVETDGDMEKAIVVLREKGLATQAKKAGRVAAEGMVTAVVDTAKNVGVVLEVNSETDFVAKNEEFKAFVASAAQTIIDTNPADVEALNATKMSGSDVTVAEALQELFLKVRENMHIRRFVRLEGTLVSYIHGDGQFGVMVKLDTDLDSTNPGVISCGKDICLQITSMNPGYLNREAVPAEVLENEKTIMLAQMSEDPKMANKPEQVKMKIVEGKVGKYYSENCLLEQEFVKDGDLTVGKYVEKVAKELGGKISVAQFVRFERGEGIQKKSENFADEVASMIK